MSITLPGLARKLSIVCYWEHRWYHTAGTTEYGHLHHPFPSVPKTSRSRVIMHLHERTVPPSAGC